MFKIAIIACALLAMRTATFAQDGVSHAPRMQIAQAVENPVDAGVAKLTVRTAFTPSPSLSRQEMFGLLLLMSVPRETARNSVQGAKP